MTYSNLELILQVDSVPYQSTSSYSEPNDQTIYKFVSHDSKTILGNILPEVAQKLSDYPEVFKVTKEHDDNRVTLNNHLDTNEKRSLAISNVLDDLREKKAFKVLKGWRNELYTLYNPSHVPYLLLERAGAALFGIVTYGVHIVGYRPATEISPMKIWVPRRSYSKPTYPGMLDNTIAGGLGYPHGIFETVVKESYEEAGLDEDYIKSHIKAAGVVTYIHQVNNSFLTKQGNHDSESTYQPEVEYVYDLIIDNETTPRPVDGEVEEFYLMDIKTVQEELAKGSFKYNCALIMIDFFIRHGIITPDNEPDYIEINQRCHRRLEYPLM